MTLTLAALNALPPDDAAAHFLSACGSRTWAGRMAAARPFADRAAILRAADAADAALSGDDWLEAFNHHPRIGQTDLSDARFARTRTLSTREQSGLSAAPDDPIRREFIVANADYERRFGHIFLICASGRSGAEMLQSLRERMTSDPAAEFAVAIGQQQLITRLRLDKLVTL